MLTNTQKLSAARDEKNRKAYEINGQTIWARTRRTAERRWRGWKRGELDIDGRTIRKGERGK